MQPWTVHAAKYAEHRDRTRASNFVADERPGDPGPIDFFMWLLTRGSETILVDTGYDGAEAQRRGRTVDREPHEALAPLGIAPEMVDTLVVTHLHFDHAGGLHLFPNATLHMQAAEMAFATGPCMCGPLAAPYTGAHVCEAVSRLYSGRVVFHEGDGEIAEGVTVHRIGGHSRGLQCVRVLTEAGWLVLASDAAHTYENLERRKPFPIVVDVEDMLAGFATVERLATSGLWVPGHDPLVMERFPRDRADHVVRLDRGPSRS